MRRRDGVLSKQLGHSSSDRFDRVIVEKRLALRWVVRRIHYSLTRRDALASNRISQGRACVAVGRDLDALAGPWAPSQRVWLAPTSSTDRRPVCIPVGWTPLRRRDEAV